MIATNINIKVRTDIIESCVVLLTQKASKDNEENITTKAKDAIEVLEKVIINRKTSKMTRNLNK